MATLELDYAECGQLMHVLANAEGKNINWTLVNPLLMKIGEQLRLQQAAMGPAPSEPIKPNRRDGSGKEVHHG